ncbi:MAG: ester cyclase [Pseudomonadota bacterium]
MTDLQNAKAVVLDLERALDAAAPGTSARVLAATTSPGWLWRGMHPFHEQNGAEAVAEIYWDPVKTAFGPQQRRRDIFMAFENGMPGKSGTWVVEMGHMLGLWRQPFLGLRATGRMAFLRYAEFNRVEDGRITETAHFVDLMNLMHQAGCESLPQSTGTTLITPGPMTHDGLLYDAQDPAEGVATLALIDRMIDRLVSAGVRTLRSDLALDWHEDMLWWGPGGIGASFSFDGYLVGHTGPFEEGLDFLSHNGHETRGGEGAFGGFFGWPSLTMRPKGGYMGLTSASTQTADMRIVDLYRRDGERLAENWIFIDHLHFLNHLGIDLLARERRLQSGAA